MTGVAGQPHGSIPRDEVKRRASAGVFLLGTRGVAILLLGFAGNVIVARLLTPHDFGLVAIGMSFVLFAGMLSDGGLGGGLIRRPEPPDVEELQALTALQLAITIGLAAAVVAAAAPFGEVGWITALMVSSTPLVALQFPGKILLERSLQYRPLAIVEVSQVLAFNAWAIGLVVAGFGVWGLASATLARAAVGAVMMIWVSPVGVLRPRFAWHRIRSLVGFGVRFQVTTLTWLVQDQGLNASMAAIASVSTLGLWSLCRRLMQVPYLLFSSLWRVSFPAMSHLLAAKEDAAELMERAVGMGAVGTGVVLTALAGSAPGLIPGLFGAKWRDASAAIPGACLGLGLGGVVSLATQGYLYAVGDASAVLRASVYQTIVWFGVSLPLLPSMGVAAAGIGWSASAAVLAITLGRATQRYTPVRLYRQLFAPVGIGILSTAVGWVVSNGGGATLLSGIAGGACSALCFTAMLLVSRRSLVLETLRFAIRSMQAANPRSHRAVTVNSSERPAPSVG